MMCPACGQDASTHGCTVREEGAFCRAPTHPPPPPSSTPRPPQIAEVPYWSRVTINGQPQRRPDVVVTLPVPPSAPRVPCALCGRPVVWITLPTASRIAVDAETREPHAARCQK